MVGGEITPEFGILANGGIYFEVATRTHSAAGSLVSRNTYYFPSSVLACLTLKIPRNFKLAHIQRSAAHVGFVCAQPALPIFG